MPPPGVPISASGTAESTDVVAVDVRQLPPRQHAGAPCTTHHATSSMMPGRLDCPCNGSDPNYRKETVSADLASRFRSPSGLRVGALQSLGDTHPCVRGGTAEPSPQVSPDEPQRGRAGIQAPLNYRGCACQPCASGSCGRPHVGHAPASAAIQFPPLPSSVPHSK